MNDDKLLQAAAQLKTEIRPERDLWPAISAAIVVPATRRWTRRLAQAAALVLLVGASSAVTYMTVKDNAPAPVIASPEMVFERASFGSRYSLGPGFQDARNMLTADLDRELQRLSPQAQRDIEMNLQLIHKAIADINSALVNDPGNRLLQEQLLRTYRDELALLRQVAGLTRNVMMRNDI